MLRSVHLAAALTLTLGPAAQAQPILVGDLSSALPYTRQEHFSGLARTVVLDDVAYFLYDDGILGRELWRSDGSTIGTFLVADVCPGECGAAWGFASDALVATDVAIYFGAHDGVHGQELWRSDGTELGTWLVRDISTGLRSSAPNTLRRVGSRVFFTAETESTGRELWVSDGTSLGTSQVLEIAPGAAGIHLEAATELGGALLFGASNAGPSALWRSDGTASGTGPVAAVDLPQQNWTAGAGFETLNGRLLFWGNDLDAEYDASLWVSDGTPSGTFDLAVVASPTTFVRHRGELYVATPGTSGGLYRTDGTAAGTTQIPLPAGTRLPGNYGYAAASSELVYFAAYDDTHGQELWATDGTLAWLVADIWPGPDSSLSAILGPFFQIGVPAVAGVSDRVTFYADDGIHGRELWGSDGTALGTTLLDDAVTGPGSTLSDGASSYSPVAVLSAGALYRPVDVDSPRRLVRSDGTVAGTAPAALLRDQTSAFLPLAPGATLFANPDLRRCFIPVAGGVLFSIRAAADHWELWFANGESLEAHLVERFWADPEFEDAVFCRPFGGQAVVEGESTTFARHGLFTTTGEPASLAPVVLGQRPLAQLGGDAVLPNTIFLGGTGGVWRTTGRLESTFIYTTPPDQGPPELETIGARVLVALSELMVASEDDTELQTLDINPDGESWPMRLAADRDRAYLLAYTNAEGLELWSTDGTLGGTRLVRDIRPGPATGFHEDAFVEGRALATRIVPIGDRAVFAVDGGLLGEELWTTDGTLDGTVLLADLFPGAYPSSPEDLTRVGRWVYFVAEGPGTGRELWRTTGEPGNVELVVDLVPGPTSSLPQQLTAAGSELYFSAWTFDAGREAWRLREGADGSPSLLQIAEVAPGPLSSSPLAFLEVGGRVFFPANDNVLGFELWSVQEPDSVFSDGFESSGTAVWSAGVP